MRRKYTLVVLYSGLFIYGLTIAVTSPVLPRVGEAFDVPYTLVALLVMLTSLGFALGIFGGGFLGDRISPKASMILGLAITTAALALLPFARWYGMVAVIFLLMKMGYGTMEAGANNQMVRLPNARPATMMNIMHLFFGVGSAVGALYAGRVLAAGWSWSATLGACGAGSLLVCILAVFMKAPSARVVPLAQEKARVSDLVRSPSLWLLAGTLTFAVAIELTTISWLVTFLQQERTLDVEKATLILAGVQIGVALGRLLQGPLAERMGYIWFLLTALLASAAASAAAVLLPGGSWAFCLLGFTMASLYPVVATTASRIFARQSGTAMGMVSAINAAVNMGLQLIVGQAADTWGLGGAMLLLPGFALAGAGMAAALIFVRRSGRCRPPEGSFI